MDRDEDFVRAFEARTLDRSLFTHAGHVRAAWWYLNHHPLGEAIDRFRAALLAYATSLGAPRKYHETMTVAWLLLINERLDDDTRGLTWREFADRFPELFERQALLARYYSEETLQSARAKQVFVMPAFRS